MISPLQPSCSSSRCQAKVEAITIKETCNEIFLLLLAKFIDDKVSNHGMGCSPTTPLASTGMKKVKTERFYLQLKANKKNPNENNNTQKKRFRVLHKEREVHPLRGQ